MKQIQVKNLTKLIAESGVIHKIGTEEYHPSFVMFPGETIDMYEEVAEQPPYKKAEYDAKVAELIHERYKADEETSLINNMLDENPTAEHIAEYRAYQVYRSECKERAKNPELYKTPEAPSDNLSTNQ